MEEIIRLYPGLVEEIPLRGAYLQHDVREEAGRSGKVFVYANFVTSLDGRIAIARREGEGLKVPKATANERDWRLFQELAAQADVILSSGRYLREWAEGRSQEILQVDDRRFADLRSWRKDQGLAPHPDMAVISHSLDFPIPKVLRASGRKTIVFTDEGAGPARIKEIEGQVDRMLVAGEGGVTGGFLSEELARLGYRTIYSAAGPRILHLLMADNALDRIYITHAHKMLGGQSYSTLLEGDLLEPTARFQVYSIYLDLHALDGAGQLFLSYNRMGDSD